MRILALQHAWECPTGILGEILEERGLACDTINVEEATLPEPTAYNAIIALGGPQHVYETDKHPYFTQEKELIRRAVEHNIPFLGICLGGQLLAAAFGGSVNHHTLTEIGFYDVPLTQAGQQDPLFTGLPGYQKVFHWHEDAFELPPGSILLATNETTRNQAFRYGARAYGLQYHIELNSKLFDLWLEHPAFQQEITATIGTDAYTSIQQERFSYYQTYYNHTSILFENFLSISGLTTGQKRNREKPFLF
ncbi:MAG: type 1 glutamine amidotransferase [Ktedonobacteraceae bacterium]|nr:type 1 glutamine amidotransferase [Ktedonobacteraceae bacterium]